VAKGGTDVNGEGLSIRKAASWAGHRGSGTCLAAVLLGRGKRKNWNVQDTRLH